VSRVADNTFNEEGAVKLLDAFEKSPSLKDLKLFGGSLVKLFFLILEAPPDASSNLKILIIKNHRQQVLQC